MGLYIGNFMPGPGPDLVTVSSGSNDVTVISGLASTSPFTQSISSGGVEPTVEFAVDLMGNGQDNLVVANSGDGHCSLLRNSGHGLALSFALSAPGIPNPSSLTLAGFLTGKLEFWATNDGEQSASLLRFPF